MNLNHKTPVTKQRVDAIINGFSLIRGRTHFQQLPSQTPKSNGWPDPRRHNSLQQRKATTLFGALPVSPDRLVFNL